MHGGQSCISGGNKPILRGLIPGIIDHLGGPYQRIVMLTFGSGIRTPLLFLHLPVNFGHRRFEAVIIGIFKWAILECLQHSDTCSPVLIAKFIIRHFNKTGGTGGNGTGRRLAARGSLFIYGPIMRSTALNPSASLVGKRQVFFMAAGVGVFVIGLFESTKKTI